MINEESYSFPNMYESILCKRTGRMNGVTQWVGIQDAPDIQSLSADVRLGNRSGIGMVIYNDSNGETKQRGGKVSFAHHLTINKYDDHYFSFALSFNLNQIRFDIENFDPENASGRGWDYPQLRIWNFGVNFNF